MRRLLWIAAALGAADGTLSAEDAPAVVGEDPLAEAGADLLDLKASNAKLRQELAETRQELSGLHAALAAQHVVLTPEAIRAATAATTPVPMHALGDDAVPELQYEELVLALVVCLILLLFALPLLKPCRRLCETRLHRICPCIALFNFILLSATLNYLYMIDFNTVFFSTVDILEKVITSSEKLLIGSAVLIGGFVIFKFKDRLLDTFGIEHGALVLGDFRDWATCWSMRRFHALEVCLLRVEGLPAAQLSQKNDVFCEVSLGYNMKMRTRVHHGAGHSCTLKESIQLNFDPFDNDSRLNVVIKNQGAMGSDTLAEVQLGAAQVRRLEEAKTVDGRLPGWASTAHGRTEASMWAPNLFKVIDLVPAGRIYLRFVPVPMEDEGDSCCCCWLPGSGKTRGSAVATVADTALLAADGAAGPV